MIYQRHEPQVLFVTTLTLGCIHSWDGYRQSTDVTRRGICVNNPKALYWTTVCNTIHQCAILRIVFKLSADIMFYHGLIWMKYGSVTAEYLDCIVWNSPIRRNFWLMATVKPTTDAEWLCIHCTYKTVKKCSTRVTKLQAQNIWYSIFNQHNLRMVFQITLQPTNYLTWQKDQYYCFTLIN